MSEQQQPCKPRPRSFTEAQERGVLALVRQALRNGYEGAVVSFDVRPDGSVAGVRVMGQTLSKSERV